MISNTLHVNFWASTYFKSCLAVTVHLANVMWLEINI